MISLINHGSGNIAASIAMMPLSNFEFEVLTAQGKFALPEDCRFQAPARPTTRCKPSSLV